MTSKNNEEYVSALESRIEEYEKKFASGDIVKSNELLFVKYARDKHVNGFTIYNNEMDDFFNEPVPISMFQVYYRRYIKNVFKIPAWIKENTANIIFISLILSAVFGIGTFAYLDIHGQQYRKEMGIKIDGMMTFDTNNDGVITDEERRIVIRKFAVDNNLKINEEDFYECVYKKKYDDVFYSKEKCLSVDDLYNLTIKKVEK